MSSRITPSVQRLLDRLANTPVAVFDATWTLVVANAPYDALMGPRTTWRGLERNSVWRHVVGTGSRALNTPEHQEFGRHKVIDQPGVGHITLDRLRIMIYTAEPDTEDAERLALAVVLGTPIVDRIGATAFGYVLSHQNTAKHTATKWHIAATAVHAWNSS